MVIHFTCKMNLIPPLSIYILGNKSGYLCTNFNVGKIYSSWSFWKNKISSFTEKISNLVSPALILADYNYDFLGIMSSTISSKISENSDNFPLIPLV